MKLSKMNAKYGKGGKSPAKGEWEKQKEWEGNPSLGLDSWKKMFPRPGGGKQIPVYIFGNEKEGWMYSVSAGASSDFSYSGSFPGDIKHGSVEDAKKYVDEKHNSGKLIFKDGGSVSKPVGSTGLFAKGGGTGKKYIVSSYEERGHWTIDVSDPKSHSTKWDYSFEGGEDETSLIDDGFMKNMNDISGLEKYLKSMDVIGENDSLILEKDYKNPYEDWSEVIVPTWALSALVNNDRSGLTDEDEKKIDEFDDKMIKRYGNANVVLGDEEDMEPTFSYRNDIDGNLGADVVKMYIKPSEGFAKGGSVNKKLHDGRYITLAIENGRLHIALTKEGKAWVKEHGDVTENNFDDLIDDIRGNSEMDYFRDASDVGVGMTSAPIITQGYYYGDEGMTSNENANVWWSPGYEGTDAFYKLNTKEGTYFEPSPENKSFAKGGEVTESMSKVVGEIPGDQDYAERTIIVGITKDGSILTMDIDNGYRHGNKKPYFSMTGTEVVPFTIAHAKSYAKQYWKNFFDDEPEQMIDMNERFGKKFRTSSAAAQFVLDTDGELHGFDSYSEFGEVAIGKKDYIFHHEAGGQLRDYYNRLSVKYITDDLLQRLLSMWDTYHLKELPSDVKIPVIEQNREKILADAVKRIEKKQFSDGGKPIGSTGLFAKGGEITQAMSETGKTLVTFHTGRGGRFHNAGHTEYVDQDKTISNYTDNLFTRYENLREVTKQIGDRSNLLSILESANEDIEVIAAGKESAAYNRLLSIGLDLGDIEYVDLNGNSVGLPLDNDGTGRIEEDGEYDTTTVMRLEDCSDDELKMILNSRNYKSKDVEQFCREKLDIENDDEDYSEGGKPTGSTGLFERGGQLDKSFIGHSVSHATLRDEDVYKSFTSFLEEHRDLLSDESKKELDKIKEEWKDADDDTKVFIINEDLFDIMNEIAPEGTSFSSNEGDGSDFGFWEWDESYSAGGKPVGSTGLFQDGGQVKYKTVDGTTYHQETPQEVIDVLEHARKNNTRIVLDYGDVKTGKSWGDNGNKGYVGRSTGEVKIPLLVYNSRAIGGGGILDDCIIKITESKGGKVLYQHPDYKAADSFADGGTVPAYDKQESYDDYHYAREIELYAENNGDLTRQRYTPIMKNQKKKLDKGVFDAEKSATLWKYWVEDADKRYQKEVLDSQPKGFILSVNDRKLLAQKQAAFTKDEYEVNKLEGYAKGGTIDGSNVDDVLHHYMAAALWSSMNTDDEETEYLDQKYGIDDIADKTREDMRKDVEKFITENAADIKEAGLTDDQVGHSFWLSRNGHGAGFFDYGTAAADRLQEAASKFKETDLEVGDDGKIYSMQSYKDGGTTATAEQSARVANSEANVYTENRLPFNGNNLEGKTLDNGDYLVLSFGFYPIWYWCSKNSSWYGNTDKFSVATAKHISQSRPAWDAKMLSLPELMNQMRSDQGEHYDLGGLMIRDTTPINIDNTLGAHAGSALPSQNVI